LLKNIRRSTTDGTLVVTFVETGLFRTMSSIRTGV